MREPPGSSMKPSDLDPCVMRASHTGGVRPAYRVGCRAVRSRDRRDATVAIDDSLGVAAEGHIETVHRVRTPARIEDELAELAMSFASLPIQADCLLFGMIRTVLPPPKPRHRGSSSWFHTLVETAPPCAGQPETDALISRDLRHRCDASDEGLRSHV